MAKATRVELSNALVQTSFGRMWDPVSADPSPYPHAAVLLTPPFNTGSYLQALRLMPEDKELLPENKR